MTQTQSSPMRKKKSSPSISEDHWSNLRYECLRQKRVATRSNDNATSQKAAELFRILNRKEPEEMWNDMSTLAADCFRKGDTIEAIVLCMLSML